MLAPPAVFMGSNEEEHAPRAEQLSVTAWRGVAGLKTLLFPLFPLHAVERLTFLRVSETESRERFGL